MTTDPATARTPDMGGSDWYRDAIFYELPVKSFYDSNADGIGDLPGLIEQLDYVQDLGISCIWLMPFYPSPLDDDGYDVSDYRAVHPDLGTMDDFRELLEQAHARGLRVAAEMVINHTSCEHPWFQAARESAPGSTLRDFYVWRDRPDESFKVNGGDAKGRGAHWSWDEHAKAFYWHRYEHHQPDLNYLNPQVREEMLNVLRFWANMGVDGLCLNGASVLVEREGTRGEHLPETHEVLREMRSRLSRDYPQLMIQAGVNAWPADARGYFGDGDECHMVPQLPLAQRMFLAIRQEQREPIVELLRNTPPVPDGCQWVSLLRNHDELTLALATDEERDYLFREYAADPSMRLHSGILRRLAPLVDNSRRRIELLYSLLFSLPGSPVIYYGDEIGMGDNVFLGGRQGIRTPMQWSAERNAGFSAADFARLFAPPVMDPTYGYEAVNVYAQRRSTSSLYRWMRRLIAIRKRSQALARGQMKLLEPANRRILAFLRQLPRENGPDDTVLVLANLARSSQPVELDLSAYAGLIPVEMFARTPFPRIGTSPYVFTLGPHSFLWFQLQPKVEPVASRLAPVRTEEVDEVPVIELGEGWDASPIESLRAGLERDGLPKFLRAQRWFGGKSRKIRSVTILDHGVMPTHPKTHFLLLKVEFESGTSDTYFVPVGIAEGAEASRLFETMRSWVIARLSGPAGDAVVFDALADDAFSSALLAAIGEQTEVAMQSGTIQPIATSAFATLRGRNDYPLEVVRGPATSSNSLVFFGRRLLFKLFRRLEQGTNPDFEIGRFFTEESRFERVPEVAGTIEYRPSNGDRAFTLGILQALVANQGDGWSHVIDELGRYFDRAAGRMLGPLPPKPDVRPLHELIGEPPPPAVLEAIGGYLRAAETLGQRTAEMHLALANSESSDFVPEPLTADDMELLRAEIKFQTAQAFTALEANIGRLSRSIASQAGQLLEHGHQALDQLTGQWSGTPQGQKTRVHGDYHLGQVLWAENDYILLDFEGEPTRTIDERREKHSPLRDVAGMLRSYHYAAYAGLFAFTHDRPDDFASLAPWADMWQQWVSAAFVRKYLERCGEASFLPHDKREFAMLLDAYMLAKALYELAYELNNRPDWVRIPLSGVWQLLEPHLEIPQPVSQETAL